MGEYIRLILRELRHYWVRSLLGMAGIAVVVAASMVLMSLAQGIGLLFVNSEGSYRNLLLMEKGSLDPCQGEISPEIVSRARRVAGTDVVAPMLHSIVRADERYIFLRAVPLDIYRQVEGITLVQGQGLGPGPVAIIGRVLKEVSGWGVGRTINMAGRSFRIVGVFEGEGIVEAELWISLEEGKSLLGRRGYSLVLLQPGRRKDLQAVKSVLETDPVLGRTVDVYFEKKFWDKMSAATRQLEEAMVLLSMVSMVAIAFGVFSVIAMTVAERRREIGILKAIGLRRREILWIFLGQGAILGGIGAVTGLALGAAIVTYLDGYPWFNFASVPITPVLTWQTFLFALSLTLILAIAGAYLPARNAAGVPTVLALRGL